MLLTRLTTWSVLACLVIAQEWRDYSSLCDKTIDQANASGVWWFQPDVRGSTSRVSPASWAYTVYHNDTMLQAVWWYNTGGANYSDDFSNGYDACAFRLTNVTAMANWNAWHGDDDGDCEKTLGDDCAKDLKKLAYKAAQDQVGESSPAANLTEGALPTVCNNIANVIKNDLPKTCQKYFDPDFEVAAWQMSDYNRTSSGVGCCSELQSNSCPIYANHSQAMMTQQEILGSLDITPTNVTMNQSDWSPSSWNAWWGLDIKVGMEDEGSFDAEQYDYFTQGVFPMLTVYMSVASNRRRAYIQGDSRLTCVRATRFTENSRHIPIPHPVDTSSNLSPGAIGGIAAGSVIGLTIILVAAFLYYRRRNESAAAEREKSVSSVRTELGADEKRRDPEVAELDKGNEVFEKEGYQSVMEMDADAKRVFEMQGSDGSDTMRTFEMQGSTIQIELESPDGTTHKGFGCETWGPRDVKKGSECDEKKAEPEIAELMGSEPEPQPKVEEMRQSWTPSVRLVENVEHDGEEIKKQDDDEEEKPKDEPKT